jgi:hypothetical protein
MLVAINTDTPAIYAEKFIIPLAYLGVSKIRRIMRFFINPRYAGESSKPFPSSTAASSQRTYIHKTSETVQKGFERCWFLSSLAISQLQTLIYHFEE